LLSAKRQGDARRGPYPSHVPVAVRVALSVRPESSPLIYAPLRPRVIDAHGCAGNVWSGLLIRWFGAGQERDRVTMRTTSATMKHTCHSVMTSIHYVGVAHV